MKTKVKKKSSIFIFNTLLKILVIVFGIYLILFYIIIPNYKKQTAPDYIQDFTKEQALEDYDYVWEILEANFPYFGVANRMYGVEKNRIKDLYRELIETGQKWSFDEFYRITSNSLKRFNGIGHLGVFTSEFYYWMCDTVDSVDKNSEEYPMFKEIGDKLVNDKSMNTYKYLKKPFQIYNGLFKMNFYPIKNIGKKKINKDTAYVKIKTVGQEFVDRDKKVLFDYYNELSNEGYENLIIDMRGAGGSDLYWIQNIIAPNIAKPLSYNDITFVKKWDEDKDIQFNMKKAEVYTNRNREDFEDLNGWGEGSIVVEPLGEEKMFNGNIYYLTDKQIYSSSEAMAQFCKQTGFATLVGDNTKGDGFGAGGTARITVLPNSGLVFWNRIGYAINEDGSSNIEFGTSPDYYSREDENPLDACLRLIEKDKWTGYTK